MRTVFGLFILVSGWITLGLIGTGHAFAEFDFGKDAIEIERQIAIAARSNLGQTTYDVVTEVSGRDITVSGQIIDDRERATIMLRLKSTNGHRVVHDKLELIEVAEPFVFNGVKTVDEIEFSGNAETVDTLVPYLGTFQSDLILAGGMPDKNWPKVVGNAITFLSNLNSGTLVVSDRVITLEGIAGSAESKAEIETVMANLPDGYSAQVDLRVEPARPYVFRATIDSKGEVYDGYIPSESMRGVFAGLIGEGINDLTPKAGVPDDNWMSFVGMGIQGMQKLSAGELGVTDRVMTLSGVVDLPQDLDALKAMYSALPQGYEIEIDVSPLDDGTPAEITLDWRARTGTRVSGKSANGLSAAEISSALNLPKLRGSLTTGKVDGKDRILIRAATLGQHLYKFESAKVIITKDKTIVDAVLAPRGNLQAVTAALNSDLHSDDILNIVMSENEPEQGDIRTNNDSKKVESFQNGFWVPMERVQQGSVVQSVLDQPSGVVRVAKPQMPQPLQGLVKGCQEQISESLDQAQINFETGSAVLTTQSIELLSKISEPISACILDNNLTVEIGGHTDAVGGANLNFLLSEKRANAVRDQWIADGLDGDNLIAKGFGETLPIADNGTAEGRAKNRRTTFTWLEN